MPRVWDPQASWQNIPVKYSSSTLPSWLAWKDDVLSGIPPPDATDCTITVNANVSCIANNATDLLPVFFEQYVLDGQEGQLSHTFTITIAPVSAAEAASRPPRRPSMAGDSPRRSTSDSFLSQNSRRCAFSNDQLFHLIVSLGQKHAPTRPRPVHLLFRQIPQNQTLMQMPSPSLRTNGS